MSLICCYLSYNISLCNTLSFSFLEMCRIIMAQNWIYCKTGSEHSACWVYEKESIATSCENFQIHWSSVSSFLPYFYCMSLVLVTVCKIPPLLSPPLHVSCTDTFHTRADVSCCTVWEKKHFSLGIRATDGENTTGSTKGVSIDNPLSQRLTHHTGLKLNPMELSFSKSGQMVVSII